jgi:uncharacterized membrane protein
MEALSRFGLNGAMEQILTLTAAIGAGLVAGVFFAFSTFVMKALRRLPDAQGLQAMQEVNVAAPAPAFMAALFGTAVVCLGLAGSAITRLDEEVARYQLAGAALYLACVVLTIAYHVPRNDALARGATPWRDFAPGWTAWNHVRTATSLAGATCLAVALGVG